MARLIDADALIEYICLRQNTDTIPKEDAEAVKHFVEHHAPTVDAVQVVRCKDCKYWYESSCFVLTKGTIVQSCNEDWFCGNGERKGLCE